MREEGHAKDRNTPLQVTYPGTHLLEPGPASEHTRLVRNILDVKHNNEEPVCLTGDRYFIEH